MEKTLQKEHTIWESDLFLNIEDWREDILAEHPDYTEEKIYECMYNINAEYLDDKRVNLDIQLNQKILVIGDLGRWNGRVSGYKEIESGNIKDCLYTENEEARWYVDKNNEFRCESIHHDGRNHYWYRVWKDDISSDERDDLLMNIYYNNATDEDIKSKTLPLGPYIAKVFGW